MELGFYHTMVLYDIYNVLCIFTDRIERYLYGALKYITPVRWKDALQLAKVEYSAFALTALPMRVT